MSRITVQATLFGIAATFVVVLLANHAVSTTGAGATSGQEVVQLPRVEVVGTRTPS